MQDVFRFGVFAVTLYLYHHIANRTGPFPTQAAADLVAILRVGPCDIAVIEAWIAANFD